MILEAVGARLAAVAHSSPDEMHQDRRFLGLQQSFRSHSLHGAYLAVMDVDGSRCRSRRM